MLRRTLRDEWTPIAASPPRRTTDGRPPLARAAGAARLGRPRSSTASGPQRSASSTTPSAPTKLDAAVAASGWRELRAADDGGAPLASGVEAAIVAEELGRGLADAPFLGPTLAAELRRLAGAPPRAGPETVALAADLAELACVADGAPPDGAVAIDAHGATTALVLVPAPAVTRSARSPWSPTAERVDLTRPVAVPRRVAAVEVADQRRPLTDDDVDRAGPRSAWR